jgi:hypothetical protein
MFKRKAKRFQDKTKRITVVDSLVNQGFGYEIPPDPCLVEIYFDQKGLHEQTAAFYQFYEHAGWCSPKGTPYRNWKVLAITWIDNYLREKALQRRLILNRKIIN